MSLEYVILGFLAVGPKTGYDLKKRFDRSVSGFWPADQSRIYRTLAKLDEWGYVTREIVEQTERPNRKVYHITNEGREELQRWLGECQSGNPPRNAFLVQLFFAGLMSDDEAIRLLEDKRRRILCMLDSFTKRCQLSPDYEHDEPERVDFFHWLTLDSAVVLRYAYLDWIDGVIERIRSKAYERGREAAVTMWPPYEDPREASGKGSPDGDDDSVPPSA